MEESQINGLKEMVSAFLPSSTSLVYVEYDDKLNDGQLEFVNQALNLEITYEGLCDAIQEDCDDWLNHCQVSSINEHESQVKSYLRDNLNDIDVKFDLDEVMEELGDFISDTCYKRDDSNPIGELIAQTRNQTLRVSMQSNYEGLDSGYTLWKYGVSYSDYFKSIVDTLYLNPAKVKQLLLKHNVSCRGKFPNLKYRDGKEFVSYESFIQELENTTSNINELTFIGLMDAGELKNYQGKITFPKGNDCGLLDSWNGAGGVFGMELLRDFTVDLVKAQYGNTEYDKFKVYLDKTSKYSIDSIYGPTLKFWGKKVTLK